MRETVLEALADIDSYDGDVVAHESDLQAPSRPTFATNEATVGVVAAGYLDTDENGKVWLFESKPYQEFLAAILAGKRVLV